jgi:hypothetical protein
VIRLGTKRLTAILAVIVICRVARADAVSDARAALAGIEGLDSAAFVTLNDRALIAGTVYSIDDLTRCIRYESESHGSAICAARLASVSAAVQPEHGWYPHASLEIADQGTAGSIVTVRFGDVPVLRALSTDRKRLLAWTTALVARLNRIATETTRNAHLGKPYPVSFHATFGASAYELRGSWNFDQGQGGDLVASVPAADVQPLSAAANVPPERLFSWWAALLQDSFSLYVLTSRPMRTETSGPSPLKSMYERALTIRRSHPETPTGATALAQAYFAMSFASGSDPFDSLLTSVPPTFGAGGPVQ